ncbi:hypothetical protein ACIP1G_05000 [Pseudomonas sp. NPDC089392]|uniref:hypothetical protein n=1 Tax=Pseudomonas sp. NPDC089392 TaxID=3364459 RepID=UPI0037FAB953
MIRLIGDKRSMAIEYRVANPASLTAHARLWFEGQQLGSLEDVIYLDGYLLGCLRDLARKPCLAPRYQNKGAHLLFNILEQELGSWNEDDGHDLSEQARPYLLTCGTLFDCYSVFAHRLDDTHGRIMWKITGDEQAMPFEDLRHTSRDICIANFSYSELAALTEEIQAVVGRRSQD